MLLVDLSKHLGKTLKSEDFVLTIPEELDCKFSRSGTRARIEFFEKLPTIMTKVLYVFDMKRSINSIEFDDKYVYIKPKGTPQVTVSLSKIEELLSE